MSDEANPGTMSTAGGEPGASQGANPTNTPKQSTTAPELAALIEQNKQLMATISKQDKTIGEKEKSLSELSSKLAETQSKTIEIEARLKERQTADEQKLKALIDKVPEDKKALIPEGLSTNAMLDYLDKASEFIYGKSVPGYGSVNTTITKPAGDPPISQEKVVSLPTTAQMRANPKLIKQSLEQMKSNVR